MSDLKSRRRAFAIDNLKHYRNHLFGVLRNGELTYGEKRGGYCVMCVLGRAMPWDGDTVSPISVRRLNRATQKLGWDFLCSMERAHDMAVLEVDRRLGPRASRHSNKAQDAMYRKFVKNVFDVAEQYEFTIPDEWRGYNENISSVVFSPGEEI